MTAGGYRACGARVKVAGLRQARRFPGSAPPAAAGPGGGFARVPCLPDPPGQPLLEAMDPAMPPPDDATDTFEPFDAFDAAALARAGFATFEHLAVIDSTMERAREIAADPRRPLPACVVADLQTRGRGRRGAGWWQAPGSLAASIVVDASSRASSGGDGPAPPVWSLACGVAVAEAVEALEPRVTALVRWPNDVEAAGRKLAGILLEALPGGRVVFGVGVNTTGSARAAPAGIAHRVATLPDLVGRGLERGRLLAELLPRLLELLAESDRDRGRFAARYRGRCGLDGRTVTVHRGAERITGVCRSIAADGGLLLDTPGGRVHIVSGSLTAPADVWPGV